MRRVYWWLIVAVGTAVLLWILPVGALQQGTAVLFFWLLIPRLGLIGPALSVLLAESVLLLGCLWFLRRPVSLEKAGLETAV